MLKCRNWDQSSTYLVGGWCLVQWHAVVSVLLKAQDVLINTYICNINKKRKPKRVNWYERKLMLISTMSLVISSCAYDAPHLNFAYGGPQCTTCELHWTSASACLDLLGCLFFLSGKKNGGETTMMVDAMVMRNGINVAMVAVPHWKLRDNFKWDMWNAL